MAPNHGESYSVPLKYMVAKYTGMPKKTLSTTLDSDRANHIKCVDCVTGLGKICSFEIVSSYAIYIPVTHRKTEAGVMLFRVQI